MSGHRGAALAATALVFVWLLGGASPARAAFRLEQKFSAYQHDDWEPAVAADEAGHVYWATTRYGGRKACADCPDPAIVLRRSSDNGATWSRPAFICRCAGVGGQHDPVLATDDQGRVFVTWMNNFEVNFARSDDFGVTWTRHGALDGALSYSDKPWIATSADGEDVYISFNGNGPAPGAPYVISSHDAGTTWSQPIRTWNNKRYWFSSGLAVTPDGTVLSAQNAWGQKYRGAVLLYVQRSTDGGETWETVAIDRARQARACPKGLGCTRGFLGAQMAAAADDEGRLYVAYNRNNYKDGPSSLFLRWSEDGGRSWSVPRRIEASRGRIDHEFPMLAATGDGDVRIAWLDNRTGRWNAWYRRSTNGGGTWSARERLSNRGGGAPYKSPAGFRFPYGDYGMIAIGAGGTAHATWGESRSYTGPGGSWYARGGLPNLPAAVYR